MNDWNLEQLHTFIVQAKAATYVGDGVKSPSCRPASHDLRFAAGDFAYLDSYFGSADFIGQEVVYHRNRPVWAMNYYGRILEPSLISAAEAGQMIRASLSSMYRQGRFLGGFEYTLDDKTYQDVSAGDLTSFTGQESISRQDIRVYELIYHGGLIWE